jgi:hypothetical protein
VRAALLMWLTAAVLPAGASETLISRADALADDPVRYPQTQPCAHAVQLLDGAGDELLVTVNRSAGADGPRERAAVYIRNKSSAPLYRLLRRIEAGAAGSAGFAPPEIVQPLIDHGPDRLWMVHISERNSGNGGWQDDHLLSVRPTGALDPGACEFSALDDIDLVPATQAYQAFLSSGESILSAAWEDFSATPMCFRFSIWGPHDPHVEPHGGTVSGTYHLLADAARPGCFRLEAESFVRAPANLDAKR